MVKPYMILARIRNNRLWRAILDLYPDVKTVGDAARKLGVPYGPFSMVLSMQEYPRHKKTQEWTRFAQKIAGQVGHDPEYLFDPVLYGKPPVRRVEFECGARELADVGLCPALPPAPDEVTSHHELQESIDKVLSTLSARERRVLELRFGLKDGKEHTLEEIAEMFEVTRGRIFLIESAALRKMRDPRRTKYLKPHIFSTDEEAYRVKRK